MNRAIEFAHYEAFDMAAKQVEKDVEAFRKMFDASPVTDWYEPHQKPVRVGWFDCSFFDCGWPYEWRVWWDGKVWREKEGGLSLIDQNLTWRGQTA